MLEDGGYEVHATANGQTMQKVRDKLPDLVLLDIWMEGINGRDICRQLKSQQLTRHIPVILISANQNTEVIAKESGADAFIEKPFDMEYMLSKVKYYIQ